VTAERPFEARQRAHDERVDVLGVEARVGQQQVVVGVRVGVVADVTEVGGRVEGVVGGVVVDHAHAVAARAGIELLGRHRDARPENSPAAAAHGRVLADDGELARAYVVGTDHAGMLPRCTALPQIMVGGR
jgi:hypothetical protein